MHLNKILEQIKRHQSPTEAIDKLATALEKHEGSLLEKGFTILKSELAANMYQNRRKLVDLVISCDGEQRKLSVSEDKTMMTDSSIGLTIATEKSQIVNMVRQSLEDCRIKKESLSKIDEEMRRCEDILKILNVNSDITTNVTKDFKELDDLKAEVKELKQLLQNVSAVRPEVIKNTPPNSAEDKKVEPEGEIKKEI